ncbi:MAG TPA: MtrB/PioB family outer membrane beta-barrel protein, partial [Vicinamibacterales bacterium]|nr:MtrB/PioB family outer membrane beta-barrel protein [Vicinamibacterales bacterium]
MRLRHLLPLTFVASLAGSAVLLAQDRTSTTIEPATTTPAEAQSIPLGDDPTLPNFVDVSGRGTIYSDNSDEGRAQRYRDLRGGGTVEFLRFTKDTDTHWISLQADHAGYRDQRYYGAINDFGRFKASFQFNQIPLFFSDETQTLYTPQPGANPYALRIDDAIQLGLQNKTLTLNQAAAMAHQFDLRLKRSIAEFAATYSATKHLDLNFWFRSAAKTGNQPWAGTFGFSDAVELPAPVQTRTTDVLAAAEWAGDLGSARIGYDGSFFRNDVDTIAWDNPLRLTDSATLGPLQGRETLWPDSNLNAGNLSGTLNLPYRSHATAYVSLGEWSQNNVLIPFTVNSALPSIPLDRQTSDAQARVTSTNFTFTSRPTNMLWLSARYRSYDFDNRTPVFHLANTVAYDTTVEAFAEGGTSPYSMNRKTFDAEASLTPFRYTAFRAGYTREHVGETFRTFDTTTQDTESLSVDLSGINWLMLRGVYEHSKRTGSGLDEQTLDDIGEQVSLRQFDISDLTSNRTSIVAQVTPVSSFSLNGSVSAGNEDRPGDVFGLRSNDNRSYEIGLDYVPRKAVSMGASYTWEKYTTLQASREANPGPQFNDPTRDWTTDGADRARTFDASMDLIKLVPKTDFRFSYDYSHAESVYIYGLAPNTTIAPVVQLPPVVNELQRTTAELRYHVTKRLGAGIVYWLDTYSVNDFASNAQVAASI